MSPPSGRAKPKRSSPSTRTGRKRYLPPVGKRERLTPFVLAGLLLRFAAGVAARTGILAVGAGSRTILLPLHVNGRLLTGTGATTTSSLRIFFHSCHINLHETVRSQGFTRTERATAADPLSSTHHEEPFASSRTA